MLSLSIDNVKEFMAKLLKESTFDAYELHSLTIHSFLIFEMNKLPEQPPQTWENARTYAFDIIKGNVPPTYIKVVLAKHSNDDTMFLNITFEDGKIVITSGYAQKYFNPDKTAFNAWNDSIKEFLQTNNISYENNLI